MSVSCLSQSGQPKISARLTDTELAHRRHLLQDCWLQNSKAFSVLTPNEQWDAHRYFAFAQVLEPAQLVAHCRQVTLSDPSLPNRAGKAFRKVEDAINQQAIVRPPTQPRVKAVRRKRGPIHVRSVVRPEPDYKKYARVLVELAMVQAVRQSEEDPRAS